MVESGWVYWSIKSYHIWGDVLPKWSFVWCLCHGRLQFSLDSTRFACLLLSPCANCITYFSYLLCRITLLRWVSSLAWCDHWLTAGRYDKLLCILLRNKTCRQRKTAKNKWIEFMLVYVFDCKRKGLRQKSWIVILVKIHSDRRHPGESIAQENFGFGQV